MARSSRRGLVALGLTLHVGEDFGWLTSGIRAVAEPIEWGLLMRGDRLGHAIAITVDPSKWWSRYVGRSLKGTCSNDCLIRVSSRLIRRTRPVEEDAWLAAQIETHCDFRVG